MEESKEAQEERFQWKIDNLLEMTKEGQMSPAFKFGGEHYWLEIIPDECEPTEYNIYINSRISKRPIDSYKTLCKLCLLDSDGDEYLIVAKRLKRRNRFMCLMLIEKEELCSNANDLLPEGTLTVLLTLCDQQGSSTRKRDDRTSFDLNLGDNSVDRSLHHSTSVLEHTDQGEETHSPLMKNISTYADTDNSNLWKNLSDDMGNLYDKKIHTDCVFKVGDSQFPVHRAVLSARSGVFAAMFNHDTKENLDGEVDVPDVQPTILSDVFFYVYAGKVRGLTPDTAAPMYTVADKYALCELRDICLDVLLNSLTIDNICDAAVLAHTHGETDLENKVINFIAERVEEFMESDKWRQFAQEKCLLANKLLCSALILDKKKSSEGKG